MRNDKINIEEILRQFEESMTEGFAGYLDSIGGKPLMGRIWGLLSSRTEPVSLSEISRILKISKPAVSNTINQAVSIGVIKKIYKPDFPRENFFSSETDSIDFMFKAADTKTNMILGVMDKSIKILTDCKGLQESDERIRVRYVKIMKTRMIFELIRNEYQNFIARVKSKLEENI
jgi:DNA-binding transcriptional regulator GbsR (MarR family)